MGLNKKGIIFSIISLMISILIITIYTVSFRSDFETEIAQVNSRAELFDVTFNIIEVNIASVIQATTRQALSNMAEASYYLYDNVTFQEYDMNAACEFRNLMSGGSIKLFNKTTSINDDIVFEIPGAYDYGNSCSTPTLQSFSTGTSFIQEFTPQNQIFTDRIELGLNGSVGDEITITILDSCKKEIGKYQGTVTNTAPNDCSLSTYVLNNQIQFLKNQTYYIKVEGPDTTAIKIDNIYPETDLFWQAKDQENMSQTYHGFNPALNKTIVGFLSDVSQFLNETYKTNANYEIKSLNIRQETPWQVIVDGIITVKISDSFFQVNKAIPFSEKVDIQGLPDPMFSKFELDRTIVREKPTQESKLNFSYFIMAINNESYVKDTKSPKFLDRFSNNLKSSSCCGIATYFNPIEDYPTLTHPVDFNNSVLAWRLLNRVDNCRNNITDIYTISHQFPVLVIFLDDKSMAKYNITEQGEGTYSYTIIEKCGNAIP